MNPITINLKQLLKIVLALLTFATLSRVTAKQGMFEKGLYFEDIEVIETVTRRKLTIAEVTDILDRQPNVKTVSTPYDPRRPFSVDTLAYPQYESRYQLTQTEWDELQAYCRKKLENPIAVDEVVAHWRSIAAGKPPFGLRVRYK